MRNFVQTIIAAAADMILFWNKAKSVFESNDLIVSEIIPRAAPFVSASAIMDHNAWPQLFEHYCMHGRLQMRGDRSDLGSAKGWNGNAASIKVTLTINSAHALKSGLL